MRLELPILSFLSIPFLLIPLPWHLRARNVPTLTIIITLFCMNFSHGVNSLAWAGSVVVKHKVWCDITSKIDIGAPHAIAAASFCITKHLESMASIRRTVITANDKRRRVIFELCLCVLFPCMIMALHYIVQGHRFDIGEDIGCMPAVYWSWPAFVILYLPVLILYFGSLCCGILAFRWFMLRRAQFAEHLRSSNSGLTTSRYMRLMALALTEVVMGGVICGYTMGSGFVYNKLRVWDNWANVHSNFSRIAQFPRLLYPEFMWNQTLITLYFPPMGAFVFFIFFGFGQDAMTEYRKIWLFIRTKVLRLPPPVNHDSVLPTSSSAIRNPSKPSSAHAMKIRRVDNLSYDEKWADEEEVADSSSTASKAPPSSRNSTDTAPPHSLPSLSPGPNQASDSPADRRVSLDLSPLGSSNT